MLGEEQRSSDIGSFSEASISKRMLIVAAGGLVNIIFGILVYFILVSISGNYISTKIDTVVPNYAAEEAGIQAGDKLIKINNKKIRLKSDIDKAVQTSNGNRINLTIDRNGKEISISLVPTQEQISYKIGVTFSLAENNFANNIYYGFWDTIDFSTSIIDNLKMLFTGNVSVDQLTRTNRNIRSSFKNKRNYRICIFACINFIITWRNKPFTIPTTRWRKNSNTFNRRYKKKTIKGRNRSKNTISRLLFVNSIINICNI